MSMAEDGPAGGPLELYEDESYAGWHTDDEPWKASTIARFLRLHLPQCSSIADVGCGTGGVIAGVKDLMPSTRVAGYEVAPIAVAKAKRTYPNIEFFVGFPEAQEFELIMMIDVVEHVEDCWRIVRDAHKCAPYLLVHIPLELNASTALRPQSLANSRRTLGHIHHFSEESACALLSECGYDIVASEITAATAELPATTMKRKLARGPRAIGKRISPSMTARVLGGFEVLIIAKRA
jgi:trans-aconitate methyltransferase